MTATITGQQIVFPFHLVAEVRVFAQIPKRRRESFEIDCTDNETLRMIANGFVVEDLATLEACSIVMARAETDDVWAKGRIKLWDSNGNCIQTMDEKVP